MKSKYLLPILTGLLVGTSYIPFPAWSIFFCLVPLWISWFNEESFRKVFWTGWLAQFVFNLIGFNWVAYTVHEFGHVPWLVAIPILLLFCALTNLYIPLVGIFWFWLRRRLNLKPVFAIWLLPVSFAITERIFPMIFDWNFGYSWLWSRFPAFQLADLIGFLGISTLTLLANGLILHAWYLRRENRPWLWAPGIVLGVFAVLNVWGYFHVQRLTPPDAKARFLMVQANIENQDKLEAEAGGGFRDVVLGRFTRLSLAGLQESGPVDFIVWPETAFPEYIDTPDLRIGYAQKLKEFIVASNTKLITGGYSTKFSTGQYTNSFFIIDETGRWMMPPYHKTVLLAFGEYVPFLDSIPPLKRQFQKLFPTVGDYGRGPGPTVLRAGELNIGAQICYEGLFDRFSRDLANRGAHLIVNLTNDSWYGTWEQPYQHLYMTLARTIETRLPMVRSTNTGISTAILANGEILHPSPLHKEWYGLYEVPYLTKPDRTFYMGLGYWLFPVLLVAAFAGILLRGRLSR